MRQVNIHYKIIILLLFLLPSSLFGSLEIQLKQINPPYTHTVDMNDYPRGAAYVKVLKDGSPVVVDKEDIYIIEDNYVQQPFEILPPENGYQRVRWNTRLRDYFSISYIVASFANEVDVEMGYINTMEKMSQIRINTVNSDLKQEHYFVANPGEKEAQTKRIYSIINSKTETGDDINVLIDSVSTLSDDFSIEWRGNYVVPNGRQLPPCEIYPVFQYDVLVTFEPKDDEYQTDEMTVYYDGGKEESINLIGNSYDFPSESNIQLIYPNGYEKLTPCQFVNIKWRGHSPGLFTIIEVTYDGGITWNVIGSTQDSTFRWKVPNEPTDHASIRVSQNFEATSTKDLLYGSTKFHALNFNSDGSKLITANEGGYLIEWDMLSQRPSSPYDLPDISYPSRRMQPIGVDYIDIDKFAVSYFIGAKGAPIHTDYVAFFERSTSDPYFSFNLPSGFNAKSMDVDSDMEYMVFVPGFGNTILIYSTTDGSLVKELSFRAPVVDAIFYPRDDKMAVALIDGTIEIYDINNYAQLDEYKFNRNPYLESISVSPNGQFLAINCKLPIQTSHVSNKAVTHVIDLNTKQKVRTYRGSASPTIKAEFNPTSNALVLGNEEVPQIIVWDLAPQNNGLMNEISATNGSLTDLAVSPYGSLIASCASSPDVTKPENLQIRQFTYAELDVSDEFFQILLPDLALDTARLGVHCIWTETKHIIKDAICNQGEVPYIYDNLYLPFGGRNVSVLNVTSPDTIWPGECRDIEVLVHPQDSGLVWEELTYQSCIGEKKVFVYVNSRLAVVEVSHPHFKFIPEIPERDLTVYNSTGYEIILEDYLIEPEGYFEVLSPKGITIPPHDSVQIRIRWNTLGLEEDAPLLKIILGPCYGEGWVHLGPYRAVSTLMIPDVNADPRGDATIKIDYSNDENYYYNGTRPFESSIKVHPRLFLPLDISSEHGSAELLSNTIENDERIIKFRVEGDFPRSGTLAEISGVAGIAEVSSYPIEFIEEGYQWGSSTTNIFQNGTFRLINILAGRKVYQDAQLKIVSISPNPATEAAMIRFKVEESGQYTVKLFNNVGLEVISKISGNSIKGENSLSLPLEDLPPGQYKVFIQQGMAHSVSNIVIVR